MNVGRLVQVNLLLGLLVSVANGGAALLMFSNPSEWSPMQMAEAASLALAGLGIVVVSALALAGKIPVLRAAFWQANILGALFALLTIWGFSMLMHKGEPPANTSWMVGVLSALGVYVFFLLKAVIETKNFNKVMPLLVSVGLLGVAIDFALFLKLALG